MKRFTTLLTLFCFFAVSILAGVNKKPSLGPKDEDKSKETITENKMTCCMLCDCMSDLSKCVVDCKKITHAKYKDDEKTSKDSKKEVEEKKAENTNKLLQDAYDQNSKLRKLFEGMCMKLCYIKEHGMEKGSEIMNQEESKRHKH